MQRAGPDAEIVDEAAAAGQQRGVFDARDRLSDPRARNWLLAFCGSAAALTFIPKHLSHHALCAREHVFSGRTGPNAGKSRNLPNRLIFAGVEASSARQTGNVAEFARADAGMVPEEAGEMGRLGKAQLRADVVKRTCGRLSTRSTARSIRTHVHIDFRRRADGGFEQPEEMRARQSGFLRQLRNAVGLQPPHADGRDGAADAPIAGTCRAIRGSMPESFSTA